MGYVFRLQIWVHITDLAPQIPGRDQYKHVVFGPDASGSGYDAAIFPFVRDAIDNGDWALAEKQIKKTADIIRKAAEKL